MQIGEAGKVWLMWNSPEQQYSSGYNAGKKYQFAVEHILFAVVVALACGLLWAQYGISHG